MSRLDSVPTSELFKLMRANFGSGGYERTHKRADMLRELGQLETDGIVIQGLPGDDLDFSIKSVPPVKSKADPASAAIRALQEALGASRMDADAVREIVRAELGQQQRPITVTTPGLPDVTLPDGSTDLARKCALLCRAGVFPLLIGPAGCGKSTVAAETAKILDRSFASISLTAGISESSLIGRLLPGEGGNWTYRASPFVQGYEGGDALFLFDELDAADSNMLLIVNQALANGGFTNDLRSESPYIKRSDSWCAIAAANTSGTGSSGAYTGRSILDASTLDRFFPLAVNYHEGIERAIAGLAGDPGAESWKPIPADNPAAEQLRAYKWTQASRKFIADRGLSNDVVVSTRFLQKAIAARMVGLSWNEIRDSLTLTWPVDARNEAPKP